MIDRAIEQKAVYESEVCQWGTQSRGSPGRGSEPSKIPPVVSSLVSELQQKIDTLVMERDAATDVAPPPSWIRSHFSQQVVLAFRSIQQRGVDQID